MVGFASVLGVRIDRFGFAMVNYRTVKRAVFGNSGRLERTHFVFTKRTLVRLGGFETPI